MDKSDETITFPDCPHVKSLFFQPQCSSTIKDEKVQEHVDRYYEYLPWMQRGVDIVWARKGEEKFGVYKLVKLEEVWLTDLMT